MKKLIFLIIILTLPLTIAGCEKENNDNADSFVSEVMENADGEKEQDRSESIAEVEVAEAETAEEVQAEEESGQDDKIGRNVSHENPDGDDFNTDGLMMDKVRIADFSYLYDKGLTYENHVALQAHLTRYLDYYVPSEDDQIWNVSVLSSEGFADVPLLYQFYVYVEELDATIECKIYKEEDVAYPYRFSCEKLDGGENK